MPRFDELSKAYVDARHDFFGRRVAAQAFVGVVYAGLEAYFGAPRSVLHLRPAGGDMSSSRSLKPEDAVRHAAGTWRFSLGLDLKEGTKENTGQTLLMDFVCVPEGDGYNLGLLTAAERFRLPAKPKPEDCVPLGDYLLQRILASYQQPGQEFYDIAMVSVRRIE